MKKDTDIVKRAHCSKINATGSHIDSSRDIESPDEGVGDVFSKSPESPDFIDEKSDQLSNISPTTPNVKPGNIKGSNNQPPSPTKERLPSRFRFDN